MKKQSINSANAPGTSGGYAQAVETTEAKRWLHISGQIPVSVNGVVPTAFRDQAMLVWQNIEAQLVAAEMNLNNIVKHTTFLSDRKYRTDNSEVRQQVLGDHAAALTVIIADIYDEAWLLEVEVIAAD